MRMNLKTIAATMVVVGCAWSQTNHAAQAAVIYDNLSFPSTFGDSVRAVNPNNGNSSDGPLADSFSTGNYNLTLSDLKLRVFRESNTIAPTASVTVSLLRDSGSNSPGSLFSILGTFSDSQLLRTATIIDLPQAAGIVLDPFTRYWILLSTTTNSRAAWSATGGDGSDSTYGTAADQFGIGGLGEFFYAGGAIAAGYGQDVFENGESPYLPYQMQVTGTIPEPASIALFGFGIASLGLLRRRFAN